MSDLAGKIAIVTGAASGIGAAVSARLERAGAQVYAADLKPPATSGHDSRTQAIALDVREEAEWAATVETILANHGRLDILANCVGISAGTPLVETTLAEWRRVLSTNLDGAFLATKHGIRAMRATGGAIVHVGSASGIRPAAGAAAYSTSKAALRMLVRTAAKECRDGRLAIRINVVSPAGVKTPMWSTMPFFQELVRTHGSEDAAYAAMEAGGGGRFIEPDAVARVVCFLASDEALHITGVEVPVDDGYVL
ncbi:MAG TPA: SDR family oxidoreductase [Gemmatimonadaceae bacterium]|nr:SDR family oxidoreductase [Gemmatimonadaceae bacterium]